MRVALEPMQTRIAFFAILLFSLATIALLGPQETASMALVEAGAATSVAAGPADSTGIAATHVALGTRTPRSGVPGTGQRM